MRPQLPMQALQAHLAQKSLSRELKHCIKATEARECLRPIRPISTP